MILGLRIILNLVRQCPVGDFCDCGAVTEFLPRPINSMLIMEQISSAKDYFGLKVYICNSQRSFGARLRIYSINLKSVEVCKALTSLRVAFSSSSPLEGHRAPYSTALGECRSTQVSHGQWQPQGPAMNTPRDLRHSTHVETKHICKYLLSESLLIAKYFPVGYGETTSQRSVASLLSSPHHLN